MHPPSIRPTPTLTTHPPSPFTLGAGSDGRCYHPDRPRMRDRALVRRRGRVYIINKVDKRYKARQG